MPPIVLDTNTIMALWFFEDPALVTLRDWIHAGHARLLTREDALEEYRRVLAYRQFACPPERQGTLWTDYAARAECLPTAAEDAEPLPRCRDADDQKFLEIARDGRAQWLLTRDKALLRSGKHRLMREWCSVLTPEAWQRQHTG